MSAPTNEAWLALATAVVRQAVEDYKLALWDYKKTGDSLSEAEALERWFTSRYGQLLCFDQGEYIVRLAKEEVRNGQYR